MPLKNGPMHVFLVPTKAAMLSQPATESFHNLVSSADFIQISQQVAPTWQSILPIPR